MEDRSTFIALVVSSILFVFIFVLIYTIYCFVYYDKRQEEIFLSYYNEKKYDKVFNNLDDNSDFTIDDFNDVISLMYNKNDLEKIYNDYYKGNIFVTLDDFFNEFYYGDNVLSLENMKFIKTGETNYFRRAKFKYDRIYVSSKNGIKSTLGIFKNITLKIEKNSQLFLDNHELSCYEEACNISKILGGLHSIRYISNNYEYYGIININDDNSFIDIFNLYNLVRM